jgi:hypothetical protein
MYRHSSIGRYLRNLFPLVLPLLDLDRLRDLGRRDIIEAPAWLGDPRIELVEQPAGIYYAQEQRMAFNGAYRDTSLLWVLHYNVPLFYSGQLVVTMHDIASLVLRILGPNRYELLMRYLTHIAVLRHQSIFLKD